MPPLEEHAIFKPTDKKNPSGIIYKKQKKSKEIKEKESQKIAFKKGGS